MAFRYSWLAGAAALLFVLYQLNDLLKPTVDGPPWQLVVVAALVLGVALTWTALAYRLPTWVAVVINAFAATIAIARVAARVRRASDDRRRPPRCYDARRRRGDLEPLVAAQPQRLRDGMPQTRPGPSSSQVIDSGSSTTSP